MVRKIVSMGILSSMLHFAHAADCLTEAKRHLVHISGSSESEISEYHATVTVGEFTIEPSSVYSFSRSIMDSWEIELADYDCFPIRIEFVGDL